MHILIVGGGLVSANLIKLIQDDPSREDHITLIERNLSTCEKLADSYNIQVFHGDGTNLDILASAGAEAAELFLALTGSDEDNLIACQLARSNFHIHSPICRVNNPKNYAVIQKLGIINTFSSALLLAKVLNQEIQHSGLYIVYDIPGNSKCIVEFSLKADAEEADKALKEIKFPHESRVVLVTRKDGEVELARGETVLRPHDRVMMVCDYEDFDEIHERMVEDHVPEIIADHLN